VIAALIHKLRHTARPGFGLLTVVRALVRAVADLCNINNLLPVRSAGCFNSQSTHRPLFTSLATCWRRGQRLVFAAIIGLLLSAGSGLAAPPGTIIDNMATLTYSTGGMPTAIDSNRVVFTVRSPAVIEFLKYAPTVPSAENVPVPDTYYNNGGGYTLITSPPETATQPVPLVSETTYHGSENLFLRLTDLDQNLDPATRETVVITVSDSGTGDMETLRLTESGPNTGIFTGYLPLTTSGTPATDGRLLAGVDSKLSADYTDPVDNSDTTTDTALVDPYGLVFDSTTGGTINSATVTLIDLATGNPATVFGDDGVSSYPATIISGGTVTDSGGTFYDLPDGTYRYPFVTPGAYRIDVVPPAGYTTPSLAPDSDIQALPGAPFALVTGSRGEDFIVNPGPALRIDIPADPDNSGGVLFLRKEANKRTVAIGDFLQYQLVLENTHQTATAAEVMIQDMLPLGFRYQGGSLELNGQRAADPSIARNGRTLGIPVGELAPTSSIAISYVVEIAAGAQPGNATNRATAVGASNATSNTARATVKVFEDLIRNRSILVGRVMDGSCDIPDTEKSGIPGVRIYLEDGTYIITDAQGMYHIEGLEPGLHVVQTDTLTLPQGYAMVPCEQSSQFAGRTFSQFVDLQRGSLWRADFHAAPLPAPTGEVSLAMTSKLDGSEAEFRIRLQSSGLPTKNLRLTIMLPGDSHYIASSSSQNGRPIDDPESFGPSLTYRLGDVSPGWESEIRLRTELDTGQQAGDIFSKALLTFDSPTRKNQRTELVETSFRIDEQVETIREDLEIYPHFPTFVAELQGTDRHMLDNLAKTLKGQKIIRVDVVGHTDNASVLQRSRHLYADNFALSLARAGNVGAYLERALGVSADRITVRGMADTMPIADNDTETGRARNRRVNLIIQADRDKRSTTVSELGTDSGFKKATLTGIRPADEPSKQTTVEEQDFQFAKAPEINDTWLAEAIPENRMIWPEPGYIPITPSTKVMVQHERGQIVEVTLNGAPLSQINYEGTKSRKDGKVAVAIWRGVDLRPESNEIVTVVRDSSRNEIYRSSVEINYTTVPKNVEMLTAPGSLIADGRTTPVIAIRLTDSHDQPLRPGMYGDFTLSSPYVAERNFTDGEDDLSAGTGKVRFQTGQDGVALIRLSPTTRSGELLLTVHLPDGDKEIRTWLKPAPRDWILVGFAEGTAGYNTFSGNQVSLDEAGIDEHFYDDGQVKFFAKGAIKGEWLLTMAYDSDKPDLDGDSLYQIIDPDTYYPLYGDGTNQGYEASSAHDIYVKLERDQFYALFGDMNTGLNQTELSRYDRNMSGFKSELQTYNFSYTLFAADTKQAFVKDEIRGDGTSGRYYLTQKDLVINSEWITLETRDRFRSEVIIDTQSLQRHIDYDIDYDDGSLFFKRPVTSKDEKFNPIFIVARYETYDSDDENFNYGGRAAVKVLNQKVEVGASYVHEERGSGKGDLYGTDATVKLTPQTTLFLEAARTENKFFDDDETDDAYLAEISHTANRINTRAYFLEQDENFGLGQQNLSESGTRKYGAEASYQFFPKFSLAALAYHEDVMANDNKRDVGEFDARYQAERYGFSGGFRHAEDRLGDGRTMRSEQILAGANWFSADTRLNLRADHEQSLNGMNKNVDFPTRSIVGLDYQINQRISVFAEQEFTWGKEEDTEGTRVGFNATPWQGGDVSTTVERQMAENSQRIFAIFGLGQTWRINERWSIDAALDRSYTIKAKNDYQFNENVPTAQGSDDDFTSVSVGSTYRKAKWTWWNRLETRQADNEDKYGVSTGVVAEPKDGVAVSAKALAFITDVTDGARRTDGNIRMGMAYRPANSRWIVLNRLDFYFDREDHTVNDYDTWRIVNNLHANFRLNRRLQMSFYYGMKYVRDNYNGSTYSGYTDLISFEARYNISKRWDVGIHGSVLHSWNSDTFAYSAGADVGYSPMTNTWVSLGYNLVGFEDDDFSGADYTAQGAYMRIRAKFDQQSVKDAANWINR
jgi:uncharacterized repeat protein (TIGR01451 family)